MDYMAIITDGLAEPDLIRHLQREQRKAADQYYTPEEFYDGCRRAVDELEADYIDELRLYTYLQDDNPDKDIPEPRLSLMKYTGGRLWQSIDGGNIQYIRDCIDEAERLTSTTAPTPEPVTTPATGQEPEPQINGLTLTEIALICVYTGDIVDVKTAPNILKKYNSPLTSGRKLIEHYTNFLLYPTARRSSGDNARKDNPKLKRLKKVIEYLRENNHDTQMAEFDLKSLEDNIKQNSCNF